MYAVIFRATVGEQDQSYFDTAQAMREIAINEYGCLEFVAVTEGDQEIAISYWQNQQDIRRWREDPRHQLAQQQGQASWYKDYRVEVVEITRSYQFPK